MWPTDVRSTLHQSYNSLYMIPPKKDAGTAAVLHYGSEHGAKKRPPHLSYTSYLQNPFYFMHASLIEGDFNHDANPPQDATASDKDRDRENDVINTRDTGTEDNNENEKDLERETLRDDGLVLKDNRTKATTGSCVSALYPLKDFEDSGTESGFFVFPDLSVRMEGTYRLKFSLYEMTGRARPGYIRPDPPMNLNQSQEEAEPLETFEDDPSITEHASQKRIATSKGKPLQGMRASHVIIDRQSNHQLLEEHDTISPAQQSTADVASSSDSTTRAWRTSDVKYSRNPTTQRDPHEICDDVDMEEGRSRSHHPRAPAADRHPEHGVNTPPDHNPAEQYHDDYPDMPYERLRPNYDTDYPTSSNSARQYGRGPAPMYRSHPMMLDSRYELGGPHGPRPSEKRMWPPHYLYPELFYFYYPPPRGYPEPYMQARGYDPRCMPFGPPARSHPMPYSYLPAEYLTRGGVPVSFAYPPGLRPPPLHGQDPSSYPAPPNYRTTGQPDPGGSGDPYAAFPYPIPPYPPLLPEGINAVELERYYASDTYGHPYPRTTPITSSAPLPSQVPRRSYPPPAPFHPYMIHGYPLHSNMPQGGDQAEVNDVDLNHSSALGGHQQDHHRSAMSSHYPRDPYEFHESLDALEVLPSSIEEGYDRNVRPPFVPASRHPASERGGGGSGSSEPLGPGSRTSDFNLSLLSSTSAQGKGKGKGKDLNQRQSQGQPQVQRSEQHAFAQDSHVGQERVQLPDRNFGDNIRLGIKTAAQLSGEPRGVSRGKTRAEPIEVDLDTLLDSPPGQSESNIDVPPQRIQRGNGGPKAGYSAFELHARRSTRDAFPGYFSRRGLQQVSNYASPGQGVEQVPVVMARTTDVLDNQQTSVSPLPLVSKDAARQEHVSGSSMQHLNLLPTSGHRDATRQVPDPESHS
ncbi:hypothetical protein BG004_005080, partial [Podila humilis]